MPPAVTDAEVAFLIRELNLSPQSRVLDLPCGSGRHALPLAAQGVPVTGLDLSTDALALAASRSEGLPVTWVQAEMDSWLSPQPFQAAYCMGNSFGYLSYQATQRWLANVHAMLDPGSAFILETGVAAECILPHLRPRAWYQVEDILMTIENHYDPHQSCLRTDFAFVSPEGTQRGTSYQHVYTIAEIQRLLQAAGFDGVQALGDLDANPFQMGQQRVLMKARKA